MAAKIIAWSFSRYQDYKQCPLRFKLKHIDKLKEPSSPAMDRGAAIHTLAESYIKGILKKFPPELKAFKVDFKMLRKQYKKSISGMAVEDTWAFTKNWTETQWNDWLGCAVRVKLDCAYHEDDETMIISDWKTGKFRQEMNDDYMEQLELYALAALLLHEHIQKAKPRLVYLDTGVVYPETDLEFTRADIPRLKKIWETRTKPMLNDTLFAPKPNDKCRWCHFSKAKNGPCKF